MNFFKTASLFGVLSSIAQSSEEPNVHILNDAIFEDVTKAARGVTAGDWLINFKAPVPNQTTQQLP